MKMPSRTWLWAVAFLLVGPLAQAWAQPLNVTVKTVLASSDGNYMDPQLSRLTDELKSVFRYTSYRLLAQDRLKLQLNQTGATGLPGQRRLNITPLAIEGQRVRMRLVLMRQGRAVFNTDILLRNRGSITVGGPRYENGYLLFNVSSFF